jgi:hypothetical protein
MSDYQDDIAWLNGFRKRLEGKPRPLAGLKAQGWDDADAMMKLLASPGGGYGAAP